MSVNQTAKQIVKEYFSNALIVDDEFEINELLVGQKETNEFMDLENYTDDDIDYDEIDYIDEEQVNHFKSDEQKEVAAAKEIFQTPFITHSPLDVFKSFIDTGIVTYPYKYNSGREAKENISTINNVLKNSQILIIDWEMEPNTGVKAPGNATKEIIKSFLSNDTGIKCAVIYTKGNLGNVLDSIKKENEFEVIDEESFFFQTKKENEGCSLFGFIMDKGVSPDQIINKITDILVKDKSITLHFMECVNKLDKNMHKTLKKFDTPFEKVLFSQIFTSDISNNEITSFINNTLLSDLMDEFTLKSDTHFLFERKKEKIKFIISKRIIKSDAINDLMSILKINFAKDLITKNFRNEDFLRKLEKLLDDPKVVSFETFRDSINSLCETYHDKPKKHQQIVNEVVLFILLVENYINEKGYNGINKGFKDSFLEETITFTRMMKFYSESNVVQTGTIIKRKDRISGNDSFYFCITPVCDIARLNLIGNKYKFLVGTRVNQLDDNTLKNSSAKEHCTSVPDINNKQLIFIKWKFYEVETISKDTIEKEIQTKTTQIIGNMKLDYSQSIINKYIAYQSRAGVYEMFYKESDYIPNFFNIISQPPLEENIIEKNELITKVVLRKRNREKLLKNKISSSGRKRNSRNGK